MVKLGTVAVDGTKIKANANRHKAMSHGRMQTTETELMAQIADLVKKAASTDEAERDEPKNEWALNAFACQKSRCLGSNGGAGHPEKSAELG